mmetsp:Transcript_20110/g.32103  ORF Transcript_20110/g.32103 Transcript_20110/m.32103 type:complete len:216 (-) Transcript_20110:254-901(-)
MGLSLAAHILAKRTVQLRRESFDESEGGVGAQSNQRFNSSSKCARFSSLFWRLLRGDQSCVFCGAFIDLLVGLREQGALVLSQPIQRRDHGGVLGACQGQHVHRQDPIPADCGHQDRDYAHRHWLCQQLDDAGRGVGGVPHKVQHVHGQREREPDCRRLRHAARVFVLRPRQRVRVRVLLQAELVRAALSHVRQEQHFGLVHVETAQIVYVSGKQ